jgi:hypothetical protein
LSVAPTPFTPAHTHTHTHTHTLFAGVLLHPRKRVFGFVAAPFTAPHRHPTTHPRAPPQLVKVRVGNPNWDAQRVAAYLAAGGSGAQHMVYAMRLKGSAKVNRALQRQGLAVDVRDLTARKPPPLQ